MSLETSLMYSPIVGLEQEVLVVEHVPALVVHDEQVSSAQDHQEYRLKANHRHRHHPRPQPIA